MNNIRTSKVTELLREQISRLIQEDLPEQYGLVTVTEVRISPDYRDARVYVSFLQQQMQKNGLKALDDLKPTFQRVLGRKLSMKFTPKISFSPDNNLDQINRVEELLNKIETK